MNVREGRERAGISQSELGRRMASLGWQWHPQTVQRVEAGQRKVSIGEAEAVGGILGIPLDRLLLLSPQAIMAVGLDERTTDVGRAWDQISAWTRALVTRQEWLASAVNEAEQSPYANHRTISRLLDDARKAQAMTPGEAIAYGLAEHPYISETIKIDPTAEDDGDGA